MTDPLVKACDLYPRTSRGPGDRQYWVGYMGGLKVLIFRNHNPQPDGPSHALFITARPPRQEKPQPQPSAEVEPAVAFGSKAGRDQRVTELAAAFDRRGPDDEFHFDPGHAPSEPENAPRPHRMRCHARSCEALRPAFGTNAFERFRTPVPWHRHGTRGTRGTRGTNSVARPHEVACDPCAQHHERERRP